MIELEHTRDLLKELGLSTAAELLDARLEAAAHSELTYLSFLGGLLEVENAERRYQADERTGNTSFCGTERKRGISRSAWCR